MDPVLRAKYIDFCSAHLTEVFLALSDERIYELVEEAAREESLAVGGLGFRAMVRLVTQKLREEIRSPTSPPGATITSHTRTGTIPTSWASGRISWRTPPEGTATRDRSESASASRGGPAVNGRSGAR